MVGSHVAVLLPTPAVPSTTVCRRIGQRDGVWGHGDGPRRGDSPGVISDIAGRDGLSRRVAAADEEPVGRGGGRGPRGGEAGPGRRSRRRLRSTPEMGVPGAPVAQAHGGGSGHRQGAHGHGEGHRVSGSLPAGAFDEEYASAAGREHPRRRGRWIQRDPHDDRGGQNAEYGFEHRSPYEASCPR